MRTILLVALAACAMRAETGANAWLRYAALDGEALRAGRAAVPAVLVVAGDELPVMSARDEMLRGVRGMLGRTLRLTSKLPAEPALVMATVPELSRLSPGLVGAPVAAESYVVRAVSVGGVRHLVLAGGDARGVLYGAFALLRKLAAGEAMEGSSGPYASVRWVNEWDNLDGTIERGYGGRSLFWEGGKVREDLTRVGEYGRLLASLGINGCAINNVNANPKILDAEMVSQIKRIAEAFRPWGVRVAISVDFGSPKTLGGLESFDPLDAGVVKWWASAADRLYGQVPDLAGFVLKADSEGRVGPSFYQRSHADAANAVARALAPHGGLLFYRGFVYDHHMDWKNPKNDRARAAVDNFLALDGKFDANVLVQIKNGPIDFQVREPVSPLLGVLEKTNQALELQITQEYFGQGRQVVYLAPQWKEVLDFDLQARGAGTPVKALAAGKTFGRPVGGFVGVSNVGLSENWFGNTMSQANLYAFGRLAWDPGLRADQIAEEWTGSTFGLDPVVLKTLKSIQMSSWRAYEDYTGPLGLQTLTDITGNHFSVAVEASERNGWGQWHNADAQGVGMDRTVATGTGYAGQYRPAVAAMYESVRETPDELLLFFHHVPYGFRLHSGKTVIQSIYDSHYAGAAAVDSWVSLWQGLRGRVDDQRFAEIDAELRYQAGHAVLWRDAVSNYFLRLTGVADAAGRVGNHPGRVEAEAMTLAGYQAVDVNPWEAASGGKAVVCTSGRCSAAYKFAGTAGWYRMNVQYFDMPNGVAKYRLLLGTQVVDSWVADDRFPARKMDASAAVRRTVEGLALRPGDVIRVEGAADAGDPAGLDYLEIIPAPQVLTKP